MIVQNDLVYNISFGLQQNYFGDLLYLNCTINLVEDFVKKPHNINKTLFELVNHLINTKPMEIL